MKGENLDNYWRNVLVICVFCLHSLRHKGLFREKISLYVSVCDNKAMLSNEI